MTKHTIRTPLKFQPPSSCLRAEISVADLEHNGELWFNFYNYERDPDCPDNRLSHAAKAPHKPGDKLMLGEEWRVYEWDIDYGHVLIQYTSDHYIDTVYAEDQGAIFDQLTADFTSGNKDPTRIRPAHTLSLELRRIEVEVVSVKVERLQGKVHESIDHCRLNSPQDLEALKNSLYEFKVQWNEEHPNHPWDTNPYVWVITGEYNE